MQPADPFLEFAATIAVPVGERLYLLLDQSGVPGIAMLWPEIKGLPRACILGLEHAQPDGASPLVVDVSDKDSSRTVARTLERIYAQARFANALSFICSRLPLDEVTNALCERTKVELPDQMSVLLRFFDTRTLPLLPRLLTTAQYAAFVSAFSSWHYVDRYGQLIPMQGSVSQGEAAIFKAPLILNVEQERLLIDDGTADAVIDQLIDQRHPVFAGTSPPQQYDMIAPLVEAARKVGISDLHEVLLFCCAGLTQGRDFEQRPPWAERLAQHRRGAISLQEALTDAA